MCLLYSLRQPSTYILRAHRYTWQQWRRYRIFPGEEGQILRAESGGTVEILAWGFRPSWARAEQQRPLARSETVADRPGFDAAFRRQRCLVFADGFFMGMGRQGERHYFYFQQPSARPFAFAGVWTQRGNKHRTPHDSFAILTCPANATVGLIHERMPVILGEGFHDAWLDKSFSNVGALKLMLRSWSDRSIEGWEVTPDLYIRPDLDYNPAEPIGPKLRPPKARARL